MYVRAYAYINNGVLQYGNNISNVARTGVGRYTAEFINPVNNAVVNITPKPFNTNEIYTPIMYSVNNAEIGFNLVKFVTSNAYSFTDGNVHLSVLGS